MKRSEILFTVLKVPVDLLCLVAGFWLAYQLRDAFGTVAPELLGSLGSELNYVPSGQLQPISTYFHYLGYIIPGMLLIFAATGLYAIRSELGWFRRALQVLIGVSVGEFVILLLFLLKANFFLPRSTVLYSWVLCTVLVLLGRALVRGVQKLLYQSGVGVMRVGVVGKNAAAERLVEQLKGSPFSAYRLAGWFAADDVEAILAKLDKEQLDELIVVADQYGNDDLVRLRNHCLEGHIGFSFVPSMLTALDSSFDIRQMVGLPLVEVRPTPLEGWGRVVKRIFDILASLFLIILFSPVFLIVAALMKLTSPGPLIYKHLRYGRERRPIYVWKFRTFKWEYCTGSGYDGDAIFKEMLEKHPELKKEWESTFKLKNDFRISLPGKFLRKSSLDELPQFFNVLRGELSLVGPRPIVKDEVQKYGEKARILFTVRPGVTGPWQVSGRNDVTYAERIALDSHYIEHWNLWTDLVVMFKTGVMIVTDIVKTLLGRKSTAY